jgi:hypothetical protein
LQEIAIISFVSLKKEQQRREHFQLSSRVEDPNPDPQDPHVIRPTGSGSISQNYGSVEVVRHIVDQILVVCLQPSAAPAVEENILQYFAIIKFFQ